MHTQATIQTEGFSQFLRTWRKRRRMSQLDLAMAADMSQRHISFLESGRSNPSRAAIISLGDALEMPAAEVDIMLRLAGFSSHQSHRRWDSENRRAIDLSIDHVLNGHNPYPAVAVDRIWNLQKANDAALMFFAQMGSDGDLNLLRSLMKPGPLRDKIVNWADCTRALMRAFELEAASRPNDSEAQALLRELYAFSAVKEAMREPITDDQLPVMTIQFQVDNTVLSLFSLIATVGMNRDARLDDIRIETLLPADDMTREWFLQFLQK